MKNGNACAYYPLLANDNCKKYVMENVKMQYGQKLPLAYPRYTLASPPRKTDLPVYIIFTNG